MKAPPSTPWSTSTTLRVLVENGKRRLQQRQTRTVGRSGQTKIEERWIDVPVIVND